MVHIPASISALSLCDANLPFNRTDLHFSGAELRDNKKIVFHLWRRQG